MNWIHVLTIWVFNQIDFFCLSILFPSPKRRRESLSSPLPVSADLMSVIVGCIQPFQKENQNPQSECAGWWPKPFFGFQRTFPITVFEYVYANGTTRNKQLQFRCDRQREPWESWDTRIEAESGMVWVPKFGAVLTRSPQNLPAFLFPLHLFAT